MENPKYFLEELKNEEIIEKNDLEILQKTKKWLDRYFNGEKPQTEELPILLIGNEFRKKVWKILCKIPYGKTVTYGEVAKKIGNKMSARAVGNAIGHNPISIVVPCHRVIGKDGSLTGYAGGIDKKIKLLQIENIL